MCDNAMTYNRPDTVYYKLAKKILHAGFKMMSKVRGPHRGWGQAAVASVQHGERHHPSASPTTLPRASAGLPHPCRTALRAPGVVGGPGLAWTLECCPRVCTWPGAEPTQDGLALGCAKRLPRAARCASLPAGATGWSWSPPGLWAASLGAEHAPAGAGS